VITITKHNFVWPLMNRDIKHYCEFCEFCQKHNKAGPTKAVMV